jgi:hypothetical protein
VVNLVYAHSWCPECYGNKPLTIEIMREIAEARGGECVSPEYHGLRQKLRWKCSFDHEWEATPLNVKNHGSWCPHCKVNVGEELVRAALEEAFPGKAFVRTRSEPWMHNLELDGYNAEISLAFEYQGRQHFERVEHFQREDGAFEAQLERDARTQEYCDDAKVVLLIAPFTVGFTNVRSFVRHWLEDMMFDGVAPAVGTDAEFYDRVRAQGPDAVHQFNRVVEVIRRKGGECISTRYLGYRVPMRIRCGSGHEFEATPEAVSQPSWRGPRFCPECGGTRRKTDKELQARVEAIGYVFLGVESRVDEKGKSRRHLSIQCSEGHVYEVTLDNFRPDAENNKKGRCPTCHHAEIGGSKRGNITHWCDHHGIRLAEGEYANSGTLYKWRCDAAGHEFVGKLAVLKQMKSPCTECWIAAFEQEHSLQLMTPWTATSTSATVLTWRCLECDTAFNASKLNLGVKKTLCETCAQQQQQQQQQQPQQE